MAVYVGIICGMLCFSFVFLLGSFWNWLLLNVALDRESKDILTIGAALAVSVLIGFLSSRLFQKDQQIDIQQHQAIERGYALYCPHDGEFSWVGECEQEGEE